MGDHWDDEPQPEDEEWEWPRRVTSENDLTQEQYDKFMEEICGKRKPLFNPEQFKHPYAKNIKNAEINIHNGKIYHKRKDFIPAARCFRDGINLLKYALLSSEEEENERDKLLLEAYFKACDCHYKLKDHKKVCIMARESFCLNRKKTIENHQIMLAWGCAKLHLGDYDNADRNLRRALKIKPEDKETLEALEKLEKWRNRSFNMDDSFIRFDTVEEHYERLKKKIRKEFQEFLDKPNVDVMLKSIHSLKQCEELCVEMGLYLEIIQGGFRGEAQCLKIVKFNPMEDNSFREKFPIIRGQEKNIEDHFKKEFEEFIDDEKVDTILLRENKFTGAETICIDIAKAMSLDVEAVGSSDLGEEKVLVIKKCLGAAAPKTYQKYSTRSQHEQSIKQKIIDELNEFMKNSSIDTMLWNEPPPTDVTRVRYVPTCRVEEIFMETARAMGLYVEALKWNPGDSRRTLIFHVQKFE